MADDHQFRWLLSLCILYGIDLGSPAAQDGQALLIAVFVRLTIHLGKLLGIEDSEIALLVQEMLPGHNELKCEPCAATVASITDGVAASILTDLAADDRASLLDLGDLLVHWHVLATWVGVDAADLVDRGRLDWLEEAVENLGYGRTYRAGALPAVLLAGLHAAIRDFDDEVSGRSGRPRVNFTPGPEHSVRSSTFSIEGLVPTLRFYLTDEEFREASALFYSRQSFGIGRNHTSYPELLLFWTDGDGRRLVGVELAGVDGLLFLHLAVMFGMVRVDFVDIDNQLQRPVVMPLYIPETIAESLLDEVFLAAIAERSLTAPNSIFYELDVTRHRDVLTASPLLRTTVAAHAPTAGLWSTYDSELAAWQRNAIFGTDRELRPRLPIESFNLPVTGSHVSDYFIAAEHVAVHIDIDPSSSHFIFCSCDSDNYVSYVEVAAASGTIELLEQHRDDVRAAVSKENGRIDSSPGGTLARLITELTRAARDWVATLPAVPAQIWYAPSRRLAGAPLGLAVEDGSSVVTVRFPSLALSAMVASAVRDDGSDRQKTRSVRLFDCSYGPGRLETATQEINAVSQLYATSTSGFTAEDFLNSTTDVVHVSAHASGADSIGANRLALGAAQDDPLTAYHIISQGEPVRPSLFFLDSCAAGAADHHQTFRHESASVADALVLQGAEFVVAALWPIADSCGAWYSVVFHLLYTSGWAAPAALRGVREYFRGTLAVQDPQLARKVDERLDEAFGDRSDSALERASSLEHLAAFEVSGRLRPVLDRDQERV